MNLAPPRDSEARFRSMLEDVAGGLRALGAKPAGPPAPFGEAKSKGRTPLELSAQFFELSGKGEFRTVRIHGRGSEILTMFFFPSEELDLPLLAMEYVILGRKPTVAVLDLPCLSPKMGSRSAAAEIVRHSKKRHGLTNSGEMPGWYRACRSGYDLFLRPESLEDFDPLLDFCGEVVSAYLKLVIVGTPLPEDQMEPNRQRIRMYKDHHRLNCPGAPMLSRCFGEEWTEKLLSEHLFA